MKKSRIYKFKNRIRICAWGEDKLLLLWLRDSRCSLTGRQLRRRCQEYLYGKSNMSIEDIVGKPCHKPEPRKPRDYLAEEARAEEKLSKQEKWVRLCNRVAIGTLMSPRLSESVRYSKMAQMVRGE